MRFAKIDIKDITKSSDQPISLPDIEARIAERAYYKSESRGFAPGHELNDWLEAEHELIYCENK